MKMSVIILMIALTAVPLFAATVTTVDTESAGSNDQNFNKVLNKALEVSAIAILKNIYLATNALYNEEERGPQSLDELIQRGLLQPNFDAGVNGKYKFRLESKGMHFAVNADPAEPESGLKYLYINEEGHIRQEAEKPAGSQSPKRDAAEI